MKKLLFSQITLIAILIAGAIFSFCHLPSNFVKVLCIVIIVALVLVFRKILGERGWLTHITFSIPVLNPYLARAPFMPKLADRFNNFLIAHGIPVNFDVNTLCAVIVYSSAFLCLCVEVLFRHLLEKPDDPIFEEKSFSEKRKEFRKTLRQQLERLEDDPVRYPNQHKKHYIPIPVTVELSHGRQKRRFPNLLNFLKKEHKWKKSVVASLQEIPLPRVFKEIIKDKEKRLLQNSVYLVQGEPGAGKSFSLRRLCMEILDEPHTKRIPVYVNLGTWAVDDDGIAWSVTHTPNQNALRGFLRKELLKVEGTGTQEFVDKYFDKLLEAGWWYFIFDAFDEIPCILKGGKDADELINKFSELFYNFLTDWKQNGGIVASRNYHHPTAKFRQVTILRLEEFDNDHIITMLKRNLPQNGRQIAKDLFQKSPNLITPCRNPFKLSLLIRYLEDNRWTLPDTQKSLFESFIDNKLSQSDQRENALLTAKMLALSMQESKDYALEYPVSKLKGGGLKKKQWDDSLKILEKAGLCRFGGQKETVSFRHRRFQEYFIVQSILDGVLELDTETYDDIPHCGELRDALVLYCEVAEMSEVQKIAAFCWNIVQGNAKKRENIHNLGCVEMVHTLYFMEEAFRSRPDALEPFLAEFQDTVETLAERDTDYIIQCAATHSMILFEPERRKELLLKIFALDNRWLQDIIVRNCQDIEVIDKKLEAHIKIFLYEQAQYMSLRSFFNMNFSLSLSDALKGVRRFYVALFSMYACNIAVIGLWVLLILAGRINSEVLDFSGLYMLPVLPYFFSITFAAEDSRNTQDVDGPNMFLLILPVCAHFLAIPFVITHIFPFKVICCATYLLTSIVPAFYFYYKIPTVTAILKDFKSSAPDVSSEQIILALLYDMTLTYVGDPVSLFCLSCVLLIGIFFSFIPGEISLMLMGLALFAPILRIDIKDKHYLKSLGSPPDDMERRELEEKLSGFCSRPYRTIYVESLLNHGTILTGDWPEGKRPYYRGDHLRRSLAQLDALSLGKNWRL